MKKKQPDKPLKSSAATFEARMCSAPSITLPEFKNAKPVHLDFHTKTNLFALTLIRLWTNQKKNEGTNFIPQYQYCAKTQQLFELRLPSNVVPFHQQSAIDIKHYFLGKFAQNLGSLSLLNVFMSSAFTGRSLGILTSTRSYNLFFTQKLSPFWLDYFKDSHGSYLFEPDLIEKKIIGFTLDQTQKKWWDDALDRDQSGESNINLMNLFMNEMFETTLRIMLTPNEFLHKIAKLTLGGDQLANSFYTYFFNKINRFKSLVDNTIPAWQDYIKDKGYHDFEIYLADALRLWINGELVIKNADIHIPEAMIVNAMSQHIPHLENVCVVNKVKYYSLNHKIDCVNYFIQQAANYTWFDVSTQPDHEILLLLDQLTDGLHDEMSWILMQMEFTAKTTLVLNALLIKSIEFQKHNIATFLVLQKPELLNNPALINSSVAGVQVWVRHCSLYFAQESKNESLIYFLKQMDEKTRLAGGHVAHAPLSTLQSRAAFFSEKSKQDNSKNTTYLTFNMPH